MKPAARDGLCAYCFRLARFFGKDPQLFAFEPTDAYKDERDAVELPWDQWDEDARTRGIGVADMFARRPPTRPRQEPERPG